MSEADLVALLPLVPGLAAGLLLLAGAALRGIAGAIAVWVLGAALAGTLWAFAAAPRGRWDWLNPAGPQLFLSLNAEGAAGVFAVLVAAVALVVTVYAVFFMARDEARGRFFGFMLLFSGAMLGLVLAGDLLTLLIAWEVVGLCSYALIGFWYHEPARARDAARAFLTTRAADLGLYIAAMAAWAGGTLSLTALADLPEGLRDLVVMGLLVAAIGKSAQLPLSGWLSGAMSGPTPVSALLHSAAMVAAGAILLIKILPLLEAVPWAAQTVLWIGVASAIAGALVALAQDDLKQLLAASTVSHYGYIFAAVGAAGASAATAYLVNHAAFKALLFLAAGVLIRHKLHRLSEMGGLHGRLPVLSILFLIGALALAPLPPLGGFFAKETVVGTVYEQAPPAFWLLMAASFLTACYAGRSWIAAFAGRSQPAAVSAREFGLLAPMAVLALAALLGGLLVLPPIKSWWEETVAVGAALPPSHLWIAALSTGTALAGIAAAWRSRGRFPVFVAADQWFGLPRALDASGRSVVHGAEFLHRALRSARPASRAGRAGRFLAGRAGAIEARSVSDRPAYLGRALAARVEQAEARVLGPIMGWSGAATWRSAEVVMVVDRRAVDGALGRLTGAISHMAQWFRRRQSGLLHRYYAGATSGVAALLGYAALLALE